MESTIKTLIDTKNFQGLQQALSQNPSLANQGIAFDEKNTTLAHPLHRLCDAVFAGTCTDEEGVQLAKIFLENGAHINGNEMVVKKDTPLIAAASLYADQIALFYIDNGAELNHPGCHGGTALHWAAWCGRPLVIEKLLQTHAAINKKCIDFQGTPLFWAVHGLKKGEEKNMPAHLECVRLLVQAGADKTICNTDGNTPFDLAEENDTALKKLLI